MKVEVKILNPTFVKEFGLPEYATEGSAAIDLRADIERSMLILPGEMHLIGTGLAMHIKDPGIAAMIIPRSGLGAKHGVVLGNLVGLIDSDYQGEWKISVWNRSKTAFQLKPGDRICQAVFVHVARPELVVVEEFGQDTMRGAGGFGHTGIN